LFDLSLVRTGFFNGLSHPACDGRPRKRTGAQVGDGVLFAKPFEPRRRTAKPEGHKFADLTGRVADLTFKTIAFVRDMGL